jgi:uncharacterized membrane protein (DUF4010 family)
VAVLLASRTVLRRFIRTVLKNNELNDILIFAAATLVVGVADPTSTSEVSRRLDLPQYWIDST